MKPGDLALLRRALTPLFGELSDDDLREIVASGQWIEIEGGRRLIRIGEPANALYLLIRGRLRASVPDEDGSARAIGEVAQGEAVGEMALLGGERRNADIDAIRDSRLLRIQVEAFHELTRRHPDFLWNLSRLVIRRMGRGPGRRRPVPEVRTIAVACSTSDDRRDRFIEALAAALGAHGATSVLRLPVDDEGLEEAESRHRFVLAVTDPHDTAWSDFVLRHADRVLVVCGSDDDPERPEVGRWTAEDGDRELHARRDLVLLHASTESMPGGTARWLSGHGVDRAHHVREGQARDVERLARFLAGRAVALVLAGGGAKGFVHIGVVRALQEEGVPIDLVGGTSIGAILAATVACDWDEPTRLANLRGAFVATNPANDYQLPPVSAILRGKKMERLLRRFFGEVDIEDLWLPFFCVTSNLTASEKAVHARGRLWKALRATVSIAGVFPPVVIDGQLHVDGGTFDNMPVEIARTLDVGHVIACDIRRPTQAPVQFDAIPSPGALLLDRLLRRRRYRVPGMMTTMMQTTFLAGLERGRQAAAEADLFLDAATKGVGFLEWRGLDRAAEAGYRQARESFADPAIRACLDAIVAR